MTPLQQVLDHLALSGIDAQRVAESHSGIIVALRIPQDIAAHLAVPGGEDPAEMHVTLAFLGKADDLTAADVDRYALYTTELAALAARTPELILGITGAGTFPKADDGKDAHYLDIDGPGLHALREAVMTLAEDSGLKPSRKFPIFHPHITLCYAEAAPHPDPHPPHLSMHVPFLELWMGGSHWRFPLLGHHRTMSKADNALPPEAPQAPARAMLARLTGDLIGITRDERRARAQVDALAQHHAQATDGLSRAIRAPRGSALEDAFLDHANEARAARALAGT